MALLLPPGTEIQVTIPEYCDLPGTSQQQRDVNRLLCVATTTPHFPQAKIALLDAINKNVSNWDYKPPVFKPNRAMRRGTKRGNFR